jgi:hypothetical protein
VRFLSVGHHYEMTARFSQALTGTYPPGADALPTAYRDAIAPLRPMPTEETGISVSYEDGAWARHCREEKIFDHIVGPATASDGPTRERWDGPSGWPYRRHRAGCSW